MPMSIDDLPNELLDEIFAYVIPKIHDEPIIPINTVCRRWNRPFMTQRLYNTWLPRDIDLQTMFPKLTCFEFDTSGNYCKDLSFFKGHSFLKDLWLVNADLVSGMLNCPRLTSLTLEEIHPKLFFKDDNLEILLALLPRLEYLNLDVYSSTEDPELIQSYNQKLATMIQSRPKCQKLKRLIVYISHVDSVSLCQLFQTSSLDHFRTSAEWKTPEEASRCLEFFPTIRSLDLGVTPILSLTGFIFGGITTLAIEGYYVGETTVSFVSLLKQFPNVESLEVVRCSTVLDLKHPTRLTHSKLSFIGSVQPRLFSHLKTLDWTIDSDQFNHIMQELGNHCSNLTTITICIKPGEYFKILPKLDGVVFPLLTRLTFRGGDFELNSSLVQFFTRHGQQIRH